MHRCTQDKYCTFSFFFSLTHIFLLLFACTTRPILYWDSQKKWYCRIIPTPPGLSQSIIQHCQPMARFVYVMIYWIQPFFLSFFFFFHWQIYWVPDRWPDRALCDSELTYKFEMWVWELFTCICVGYVKTHRAKLSCNLINIRSNIIALFPTRDYIALIKIHIQMLRPLLFIWSLLTIKKYG